MLCIISIVLSDLNFSFDTLTTGLGTWPMPIIVAQIDISLDVIFINCRNKMNIFRVIHYNCRLRISEGTIRSWEGHIRGAERFRTMLWAPGELPTYFLYGMLTKYYKPN